MAKGINFSPVATDTAESMDTVVKYILGLDISPTDKAKRLSKVFNLVGSDFYMQMFDANSQLFDSTAIGTDYSAMTNQIDRLSNKLVQNYNLGRPIDMLVKDFYDSALGQAQHEAFRNAISLDKHPTLTRSMVGETCKWCQGLAGVHIDPDPELFSRHAHCDCLFVTSGYNSRNGILTNYVKDKNGKISEWGVPQGKPMNHLQANSGRVNPNFAKGDEYKTNCQTCVAVYEARRRGFDVQALPNTGGTEAQLAKSPWSIWKNSNTGRTMERDDLIFKSSSATPVTAKSFLQELSDVVEPNARYVVGVKWRGKPLTAPGHVMNINVDENGSYSIYDAQSNRLLNEKQVESFFKNKVRYVGSVGGTRINVHPVLYRVDDKEMDYNIAKDIMEAAK